MEALIALCAQEGYKPYFRGPRRIVQLNGVSLSSKVSRLEVAGYRNGYSPDADTSQLLMIFENLVQICCLWRFLVPKKRYFLVVGERPQNIQTLKWVWVGPLMWWPVSLNAPQIGYKMGLEWAYRWKTRAETHVSSQCYRYAEVCSDGGCQ